MRLESQQLFPITQSAWEGMPSTRFQGSKKKLLPDLYSVFSRIKFDTCLDAFGGTSSVSFLLKQMNKRVTFNDIMPSNVVMARALLSSGVPLVTEKILRDLFERKEGVKYKQTVKGLYQGIYFTDEENDQIDVYCQNLLRLPSGILRDEAFYLICQALLSKRPYNLFHRANLHMRTKEVKRSFGNKATWDKPIFDHCIRFLKELTSCRNRDGKYEVEFTNRSAFEIDSNYELVYIDTPYAKSRGTQESNYFNFYHFLDALWLYDEIEERVHSDVKHKPFYEFNKAWYPTNDIVEAFSELFSRFNKSTLVISYRSNGYPTAERLVEMLRDSHGTVDLIDVGNYKYVLSKQMDTKEIVIVASPSRT